MMFTGKTLLVGCASSDVGGNFAFFVDCEDSPSSSETEILRLELSRSRGIDREAIKLRERRVKLVRLT